jgi:hypothetical protein
MKQQNMLHSASLRWQRLPHLWMNLPPIHKQCHACVFRLPLEDAMGQCAIKDEHVVCTWKHKRSLSWIIRHCELQMFIILLCQHHGWTYKIRFGLTSTHTSAALDVPLSSVAYRLIAICDRGIPCRGALEEPVRYTTDEKCGCSICCMVLIACSSLSKWNARPLPPSYLCTQCYKCAGRKRL